jgi:hypothetical protein
VADGVLFREGVLRRGAGLALRPLAEEELRREELLVFDRFEDELLLDELFFGLDFFGVDFFGLDFFAGAPQPRDRSTPAVNSPVNPTASKALIPLRIGSLRRSVHRCLRLEVRRCSSGRYSTVVLLKCE